VELYLHSPIRLHGVVAQLKKRNTGAALPLPLSEKYDINARIKPQKRDSEFFFRKRILRKIFQNFLDLALVITALSCSQIVTNWQNWISVHLVRPFPSPSCKCACLDVKWIDSCVPPPSLQYGVVRQKIRNNLVPTVLRQFYAQLVKVNFMTKPGKSLPVLVSHSEKLSSSLHFLPSKAQPRLHSYLKFFISLRSILTVSSNLCLVGAGIAQWCSAGLRAG
jgi:hypothetical protein